MAKFKLILRRRQTVRLSSRSSPGLQGGYKAPLSINPCLAAGRLGKLRALVLNAVEGLIFKLTSYPSSNSFYDKDERLVYEK
jgi:hypothetical protein